MRQRCKRRGWDGVMTGRGDYGVRPRRPRQRIRSDTEGTLKPGSYPALQILLQLQRRLEKPNQMPPFLSERRFPVACVGVHVPGDDILGRREVRLPVGQHVQQLRNALHGQLAVLLLLLTTRM